MSTRWRTWLCFCAFFRGPGGAIFFVSSSADCCCCPQPHHSPQPRAITGAVGVVGYWPRRALTARGRTQTRNPEPSPSP
ncbi:hypothetical protein B484DRAFT_182247 [Ochromonadaceae sp. CCMP2298]|nr:hypothetical protein B484DRAFT_182247 [Ochromonadaceae sp. CCMP2298]